jgi:hypothetical protein
MSKSFNMGSFADSNTTNAAWTATVVWGDGTANATFKPTARGSLGVRAHTFGEEGTYTVTIMVTDTGDHQSGSATFTVTVSDPAVLATAGHPRPTAGAPFSGAVATFTDRGGAEANDGTHYTCSINWGDGTPATTGTITVTGGVFTIGGAHTFAAPGSDTITATITHEGIVTTVMIPTTVANLGTFVTPALGLTKPLSFWNGPSGQKLILSFGLTGTGQTLGQWLATTLPRLYGGMGGAPNLSLSGNGQIATYYSMVASKGSTLDALVLSTAFDVFASTLSLGGTTATAYGFMPNSNGLGAYLFDIGNNGAAFGVNNNTSLNVYELLLAADKNAMGGEPWGTNTFLRAEGVNVFLGVTGG